MVHLPTLNEQLVQQDMSLRRTFDDLIVGAASDTEGTALLRIVAEGLAAIHERQGNAIILGAQLS